MSNPAPAPPAVLLRAGRMTRLIVGAEHAAPPAFFAADAPAFTRADAPNAGPGGAFDVDGVSLRVTHDPLAVSVDVAGCDVYGFGAATGKATRNGSRFKVMTLDTLFFLIEGSAYTAMPFFIARRGAECFAVMVVTTYALDVVVNDATVQIRGDTEGAPAELIVFRGTPAEIVEDLTALVGKTFLPPLWALGFHQSRWSYKTSDEVLAIARRFREEDLPADVIHLDIHYMDDYRVFTFSPERFPNPKKMHDELRALGFRTMAIVDPGVSVSPYPIYEAVKSGDMLLKKKDGTPYEGKVWPGTTVFPDFSQEKVRDAWGAFHKTLVDAGVAGFWNDMNDPVLKVAELYDPLAEDVRDHKRSRNLYANGMAAATRAGLQKLKPGVRPMVLSRSGFLGIQRNSAIWTGDNHSTWEHLEENVHMALNLGVCGVAVVGADVGGFGRGPGKYGAVKPFRPSPELFVRWMELGSLMPFFRVHCTLYSRSQEPWSFGADALHHSRVILRRRYRLLPYLYRAALAAHETGLPIARPMWLAYPEHAPRGAVADSQFLVGDSLLAAPVLEKGAERREMWLPPGSWIDFHNGEVHSGGAAGRSMSAYAPLGRTPMFLKAGDPIFLAEPMRNAEETLRAPLALEVSAPAQGVSGVGSLFLDEGDNADGKRFLLDVRCEDLGGRLRLSFEKRSATFAPPQTEVELRTPRAFTSAIVDGKKIPLSPKRLDDRSATMHAGLVPLDAREIVIE